MKFWRMFIWYCCQQTPKFFHTVFCPVSPSHMISTKNKHAQDPRKMAKKATILLLSGPVLNVPM